MSYLWDRSGSDPQVEALAASVSSNRRCLCRNSDLSERCLGRQVGRFVGAVRHTQRMAQAPVPKIVLDVVSRLNTFQSHIHTIVCHRGESGELLAGVLSGRDEPRLSYSTPISQEEFEALVRFGAIDEVS